MLAREIHAHKIVSLPKWKREKTTRNIYSIPQLIYVHWGLFWNAKRNEMLHTDTVALASFGSSPHWFTHSFFLFFFFYILRNGNEVKMYKHRRRHLYLESWEFISYSFSIFSFSTYTHTFFPHITFWCRCLQCERVMATAAASVGCT